MENRRRKCTANYLYYFYPSHFPPTVQENAMLCLWERRPGTKCIQRQCAECTLMDYSVWDFNKTKSKIF